MHSLQHHIAAVEGERVLWMRCDQCCLEEHELGGGEWDGKGVNTQKIAHFNKHYCVLLCVYFHSPLLERKR